MTDLVVKKGYVEVKCKNTCCNKKFHARIADRNRGWGKFCSKSCKAIEQEGRTGQYKSYCCNAVNNFIGKQQKSNRDKYAEQEFYANFSNEDDGDIDDWAYEPSDYTNT